MPSLYWCACETCCWSSLQGHRSVSSFVGFSFGLDLNLSLIRIRWRRLQPLHEPFMYIVEIFSRIPGKKKTLFFSLSFSLDWSACTTYEPPIGPLQPLVARIKCNITVEVSARFTNRRPQLCFSTQVCSKVMYSPSIRKTLYILGIFWMHTPKGQRKLGQGIRGYLLRKILFELRTWSPSQ